MKICFFNRSYWPDQAATGQFLTELAEDLVSRYGDQVTVVAGRAAARVARGGRIAVARWRARRMKASTSGGRTAPRCGRAGSWARASNYVSYFGAATAASFDVGHPDVVVSLTDPPIVGLAALWAARRAGARFVFLCEDIFPEVATLLADFHNPAVNGALDRINRYLLRSADGIVALGDRMRRRLVEEKGADPARVHIIHNWADCEAIVPGPKDNAFSREHGLADRFVLMHSGNVGLSQNLDVLVEAADRLRSKERLTIAIVGDGSRRRELEAMAAARGLTNVRFLPYQPKALLHDSFASADAFLVSLKAGIEGFIVPSKVYGILAAGRPYIAATDPSSEPAQIARESGCGLVAAPGDPGVARRCDRDAVRRSGDDARHGRARAARRTAVRSQGRGAGLPRAVRAGRAPCERAA